MSSNQSNKRSSPPSNQSNKRSSPPSESNDDSTPAKKGKTSHGRRHPGVVNFTEIEDVALCKAYVNVTLNPIDGVGQKSAEFWGHIQRKFGSFLLMQPSNIVTALPKRDAESLKNRFMRKIQKKMNVYNKYYKQVKESPPSGVNTEEEFRKIAADKYKEGTRQAFGFSHCVEILQGLPKFNPMVDDEDRSSNFAVEDSDGDKKPAAVNKIGAPMGASLKRPPGSKQAKKDLQLKDGVSQSDTAASAALDRLADSQALIASTMANQHKLEKQKEHTNKLEKKLAAKQMEFNMRQQMGDPAAAERCISELMDLQKQLDEGPPVIRAEPSPLSGSSARPVEEVDLTYEEVDLTRAPTHNEEESGEESGKDSEDSEDVEEMYNSGSNAAV